MGRLVRACGRVKAYFLECQRNMAPMPNPEWYEETKHTRFTLENLRKLPLKTHVEVWRSAFQTYGQSFEESFAWSRKRKEKASKKKVEENMLALREIARDVQEATHKTPEDLAASKKALKELLDEIQDNQEGIKSWTEEKLDLIRLSLSEFSTGYREARDREMKRVMAMDKDVMKSFVQERWEDVKSASSILSNSIFSNDKGTEKQADGERNPGDWGRVSVGEATTPIPLREFLSQRVRSALDSIPKDPDMHQLLERAEGFTKERLVQAEAAARILKEEEAKESGEGEGEWKGIDNRDPREGTGSSSSPPNSETPILSGMANDARHFVEGKVGEAKEAAKEVVDTILEVRESHRAESGSSDGDRSGSESEKGVLGKGRGQEEQPKKEGGTESRVGDRRNGNEEIGGGRR